MKTRHALAFLAVLVLGLTAQAADEARLLRNPAICLRWAAFWFPANDQAGTSVFAPCALISTGLWWQFIDFRRWLPRQHANRWVVHLVARDP